MNVTSPLTGAAQEVLDAIRAAKGAPSVHARVCTAPPPLLRLSVCVPR